MTRKRPASQHPVQALAHGTAPPSATGLGTLPDQLTMEAEVPGTELLADLSLEDGTLEEGPRVLLEVDPALSIGLMCGRLDVLVRGRVVSEATITEVRLQIDDRVLSCASFGQPERAAATRLPDGTPARQRGFQFNLPCQPADSMTRSSFQIVARTSDDLECGESFVIEMDVAAARPVTLVAGPARTLVIGSATRPPSVLYIERATLDPDGLLLVEGWAVALDPILGIEIQAGDTCVGHARLGLERADVAAAYAAYPNGRLAGFTLSVVLPPARRHVAVVRARLACPHGFGHEETVPVERVDRVIAVAGPRRLDDAPADTTHSVPAEHWPGSKLGASRPLQAAAEPVHRNDVSGDIEMFCDEAVLSADGRLCINGWAVCAAGIAQILLQLDGTNAGLATYGHERLDVGGNFAEIPMAHLSGFKFDSHVGDQFEGEHRVRIIVRSMAGTEADVETPVIATGAVPAPVVMDPMALVPAAAGAPPVSAEQAAEFKFELDAPATQNGVAVETVTGRLTIDGWLLSRSGIASFEVFLDDQRLGDMAHGLARQDVGTAFPEWPNSLRSGYAFHCPPRALKNGEHTIRLKVTAKNGIEIEKSFGITIKKSDDQQDQAGLRRRVPRIETDMMRTVLAEWSYCPSFRFVVRQAGPVDGARWRTTLEAFRLQCYEDWSMLVLAEDLSAAAAVQAVIDDVVPHLAERFSLVTAGDRAWTAPLADVADGRRSLTGPLLPGDEIGADTLLELAVAAARDASAGLVYGDELRRSPVSGENEGFFKPDFSPDLLYATNYIGRPWVATAAVVARTGVTADSLWRDGEYDLVLRCVEHAAKVRHIPKLLCQRGVAELDEAAQESAALERMARRTGVAGRVLETPIPGTWRLKRELRRPGKVSIIIPTCAANGYIETCIRTLREKTAYKNYEIVVIDNIPASNTQWKTWVAENADRVVGIPDKFNWSIFNNRAAAASDGDYLLFLNDDIEIIQEDWLDVMMEHAQRPDVGAVGPQLLYRDGKVQHAGMFLANNGIGRHAFRFAAKDDPCYFGLALTQRNVMAVTGACMLMRREVFDQLSGFDEAHEIVGNDLDFSLRIHRAGLLTVFTPYATLIHYELASRAYLKDVYDLTHFNATWKTVFAAGDPFFNPRLWKHADDFRPDDEPVQWVVSGAPIFHKAEIQRILVVKLDHIGDFVTALQPIRRLKSIFPQARITVLAGRASRAFVALEPSIDELITFDFFHARSQLGERELTKEDYAALQEQLRPYRFDLAVDLRKHPSTRDVLKYTGARFLAGFDHLGQYPNLDVALDWDGDRTLQRKRSHIVDDLLSLVMAIGRATEMDREVLRPGPAPMPLADLPEAVRALFARKVVAVHPGAGNITKQWPEEHFSALMDLLIERNDVNILLVGGPDEVEVAERLMENVLHSGHVASMAGQTPLADLPRLLRNCALYIGNDSGPKHIAAAVGIPTIGIHSGVVDPVEWGPLGPNAVALRRNMTCSPCYLAKAEDCPRALACLRFLEPSLVHETADLLLSGAGTERLAAASAVARTEAA